MCGVGLGPGTGRALGYDSGCALRATLGSLGFDRGPFDGWAPHTLTRIHPFGDLASSAVTMVGPPLHAPSRSRIGRPGKIRRETMNPASWGSLFSSEYHEEVRSVGFSVREGGFLDEEVQYRSYLKLQ